MLQKRGDGVYKPAIHCDGFFESAAVDSSLDLSQSVAKWAEHHDISDTVFWCNSVLTRSSAAKAKALAAAVRSQYAIYAAHPTIHGAGRGDDDAAGAFLESVEEPRCGNCC